MSAVPTNVCAEHLGLLREQQRRGLKDLREAYLADPEPRRFLRERCRQIDSLMQQLWRVYELPETLTLVAVGGYGRGELYPASDIDILILLPHAPSADVRDKLEGLIGCFWDVGLEVGQSVRTIDECLHEAQGDITVETTLLESRRLCGCTHLFKTFQAALKARLAPRNFFRAKLLEQDERYARFQETAYSLEPNCKDSPGGLRDLQIIVWVSRACGCGTSWSELERHEVVTHEEVRQLRQCERLLQDYRIRLHLLTGRREDRLLFDVQTALAEQLGYVATADKRASEQMMQAYYRNAKLVTQLNTILLQNIGAVLFPAELDQPPQPINERFQICGTWLDVRNEAVFRQQPAAILESFLLLQEHGELQGMTARTLRALWRARTLIDAGFRAKPAHRAQFLQLLTNSRGIVHEFRRMNQYGILGRYIPAFGRIVGQMQHDLFHFYTVDQHILQVLRNVRRLTMDEYAHEFPFESRLINAFPKHWLLFVAAIFHDIAKGRGGDHSLLGMVDAAEFCADHGLAPEDSELVVWLVREHLTMSRIAQKEDISDPQVIAAFARLVGDERHLTALYLFTVCDIRGTSPKVWNAWKAQLLEGLFNATRRHLESGGAPVLHGIIAERQQEAMRLLRYFALSDTVHERLWKQLDTVYFLRHTAEEIAWHTRALHYRIYNDQPIVKARLYRAVDGGHEAVATGSLQVMVYTRDERDLFIRMAGFFARAGFSIVDAKIHTTRHGYALDSFILIDVQERGNDRELISFIEHELAEKLGSGAPIDVPSDGRLSRQVRHFPFPPQVSIRADENGKHFILSVVAADRPGLLYRIASTLTSHGANIQTAKIATLGERVEDTFLIDGGDLGQSANRIRLETELLDLLRV